ncbi:MAG: hypothetical protein ACTSVC_06585, partial [Promethearchaeota archaeon]
REINLIQTEIFFFSYFLTINSFLFVYYGTFDLFFPDFEYELIVLGIPVLFLYIAGYMDIYIYTRYSLIFFNKIERIDYFNHFWGELNQYYENCKKAFKLFRKMLIPVLFMFLALFISNYILFKNWLVLMNA